MKSIFAAATVVTAAASAPSFAEFAAKNGKKYASKEELQLRRSIYAANVAKIQQHNAEGHSWTMAVNKFADMTAEEFKGRFASGLRAQNHRSRNVDNTLSMGLKANPTSVDWVAAGAVTPIKNQGQCGSCWSFSTTGSVEGANFIQTGTLVSLSEQQLIDCSGSYGNQGCNGGLMDDAFQYVIANKGLCTENSYPYTASQGTCNTSCGTQYGVITSYTDVPASNEVALETAIVQQPVSVAVEADQGSFQFYSSGVMTAACGTQLDHGVLAVGYGTLSGQDYYNVKNSWGTDWGVNGYIMLGRGQTFNPSGQCGIQLMASYPTYSNTPIPPPQPPSPPSPPSPPTTGSAPPTTGTHTSGTPTSGTPTSGNNPPTSGGSLNAPRTISRRAAKL